MHPTKRKKQKEPKLTNHHPHIHTPHDELQEFLKVFEQLRGELVKAEKDDKQVKIAIDWIDKMVEYNVPHGGAVESS